MNTQSKLKDVAHDLVEHLKKKKLSDNEAISVLKLTKKYIRNKEYAVQRDYETR